MNGFDDDPANSPFPRPVANASAALRHVFVRDLVLPAAIGVHLHEHHGAQTIRVNVDLSVLESGQPINDQLKNVVDYGVVVDRIKRIIAEGHVKLIETLAERIAEVCLSDLRVHAVRVRVEKLEIIPEATSVGVEIERVRSKA